MRRHLIGIMMFLAIAAVSVAAQSPTLTIVTETSGLPSELFYGTVKVKPLRLRPGTNPPVPITISDADFFAQQHYLDFLRRFPDLPGHAHWTGEITECSDPAKRQPGESLEMCTERKRANTSAAFFLSPEFQNTGSFNLRVYWGSLGKLTNTQCIVGVHSALPASCRPLYSQYIGDMSQLTQGIVVNDKLDPAKINANKQAFVAAFVTRSEFLAAYPGTMTAAEYVDKLAQTTGVPLTAPERTDLIAEAGASGGRASVLFKIVDGTTTITDGALVFNTRYGQAFYNQEFDPAFVYMEYLGYLRRNPDQEGFNHWLGKLKQYGNWVDAQMVLAFIKAPEYIDRF